jgi:hypothetical protein
MVVQGLGYAIEASYSLLHMLASSGTLPGQFGMGYIVISTVLPPLLQGIAGAVLVLGAPGIASLFYSRDASPQAPTTAGRIALKDVWEIALRILGICGLLLAVRPICTADLWLGESHKLVPRSSLSSIIEAGLYIGIGGILFFGARTFAEWLSSPSDS